MAATTLKLHFLATCSAIFCSLYYKVTASDAYCEKSIPVIDKCWEWHNLLPTDCNKGNATSLPRCAEIEMGSLKGCKQRFIDAGHHRQKLYTIVIDVICTNDTIFTEFKSNQGCWKDARDCATSIVYLPIKPSDSDCQKVNAIIRDCKSKDHNPTRSDSCSQVTNIFLNELGRQSKLCGAAALVAPIALILMAYILILINSS